MKKYALKVLPKIPRYPIIYSANWPNQPKNFWNVFEKRPYWAPVVCALNDSISQREKSDASTTARVYMVGTIHDDLLTQRRRIAMGQFCAFIVLIQTTSNFLWASEVFKSQIFKSQLFSSSQKKNSN